MKMSKTELMGKVKSHSKIVATLIVGYGVGEIMGNVMKDYKPDAKGLKKALIKLGAAALTGMVIKEASKFVSGEIDEFFETVEEVSNKMDETAGEEDTDG